MPITPQALAARHPYKTDAEYFAYYKSRCVITASGCWEWQGFCHPYRNQKPGTKGYAEACYRGKNWRLNRLMILLSGRKLEPGQNACHSCDNPPCINPDHLKPGTQSQNKREESARGRSYYLARTSCPQGHPYDDDNTYVIKKRNGRTARQCRECSRIRQRNDPRARERQRARRAKLRALRHGAVHE